MSSSFSSGLPPRPRNDSWFWLLLLLVVLILICADLEIDLQVLLYGGQDIVEYLSRYGHPDFSKLSTYLGLILQTVATALWGTVIAFVAALIISPLATRNLAPHSAIYRFGRELLNLMRAIPDLLLALIFVTALGLGPLPGALALGVHTAGFLGKFFAESLERVERGRYEALQAVGAGFVQTLVFAGWPSIMREMTGYTLYIFDRNVRMASVLGLVGAGGIGLALHDTLRLFQYNQAAALILVILATIVMIDTLSTWLRGRMQ